MSRTRQIVFALAFSLVVGKPSFSADEQKPRESTTEADIPIVALFKGMQDGRLGARLIQHSEKKGDLFLANKTKQPLIVQMPEAFVGVHILNQRRGQTGSGQRVDSPNRAQSTGSSISGNPRENPRTERSSDSRNGAGAKDARKFPVAAGRVVKLPVTSVCLEFGRPTPNANMKYQIVSVEQYSRQNQVLRELIPLFVRTRMDQRIAQAAAWHVSNKLSWTELSALQKPAVAGLPGGPLFAANDLKLAKALVDRAGKLAVNRKNNPGPPAKTKRPEGVFAGFPEINRYRPGERTLPVITSDGVTGLVRPKWTRCISELGRNPKLFRFQDNIYITYSHLEGHRNLRLEATGEIRVLRSPDEGKTWESLPPQPADDQEIEFAIKDESLFRYEFVARKQTHVRISTDGETWSDRRAVYKPPFWFWGVTYDEDSDAFWCAAHAIPGYGRSKARQIHLIKSSDGIKWKFVNRVVPFDNSSESTLWFDRDRTMTIAIRRKYDRRFNVAVGRPPYRKWDISTRPMIAEGHRFFQFGNKLFMPSRAIYEGQDKRVLSNPVVFDKSKPYSVIYRVTDDREFQPWAIMDSMGDCSYPYLLETKDGDILCAYYSQHEDNVSKIFLCAYDKTEFLKGP